VDYSAGYVPFLLKAMHNIRTDVGTSPLLVDRTQYMVVLELLSLTSMVMKVVQDLVPATVTDALWQARLGIAIDTGPAGARDWPGWVLLQVAPEKLALYGATESDSAAVLQQKINAYNAGGSQ
jgi:hypothetical protein